MGIGFLKTIGKTALRGVGVVAPFLPGGGVAVKAIKVVTGAHLIPGIGARFPSLSPGVWAPLEAAAFGMLGRIIPGIVVSFYLQNADFRSGINQAAVALLEAIRGLV